MELKPIFQTYNLCKNYKEFKALDNVSMNIYEGDIYGFVGENGAGKTTLIRLAAGLIHANGGEYSLLGVSSKDKDISKAKRQLSAIVEAVALNKGLNALENLKMQCYIAGIKKSEEELNALIDNVGLDHEALAKKKVGGFSLGMRQRLGLATALITNPKFVLLDEPMNGLDPQGFIDMRETILKLNKQGVTFLISSHILSELDKVCTRVGFLSHGVLLKELSIDELHDKARRKIVIRIKNGEKVFAKINKNFKIKDDKVEGDTYTIYDPLDVNDVMAFLVNNKIKVDALYSGEETIEDYYHELMMGGDK